MAEEIKYIKHNEIDKIKWDACIQSSVNERIYAHSFYLDLMADDWDALIYRDYEAVMPLTFKRKFGISYLYQPPFTASLGIFGYELNQALELAFYDAIPKHFLLSDIFLNSSHSFGTRIRNNYILSLDKTRQELFSNFRRDTKHNIKKALSNGCYCKEGEWKDIESLIPFSGKKHLYKKEEIKLLMTLYLHLHKLNKAKILSGYNSGNELLSSAIFFLWNQRAYYILAVNHDQIKRSGTSSLLIFSFIETHQQEKILLDFEGSDVKTVADFYRGFEAVKEIYPAYYYNRLPFLFKWLKPATPRSPFLQTSFQLSADLQGG